MKSMKSKQQRGCVSNHAIFLQSKLWNFNQDGASCLVTRVRKTIRQSGKENFFEWKRKAVVRSVVRPQGLSTALQTGEA
jgi:hypothetical protein